MLTLPRITVEVPVIGVGSAPSDYDELGTHVDALRRRQGLHLTLLHIGVLDDFSQDVADWTNGFTSSETATRTVVEWLEALPVLAAFTGRADKLIVLGGGNVCGLEVDVPEHVHDFQVLLVRALHELLDELLVDNVDDFILSSRALGYRYPRWTPHVAVGRPKTRAREPLRIESLAIDFGSSRIRNHRFLPAAGIG
ncbi:hypothetical protein QFZ79_003717 [Arthrobacter sp. V4I6]|uniref:hypothetical protein n=1 Tax=unclassified Arthrobacter TaxID=235627 RepID=UPI002785A9FC|nr:MULTISPECIES: hypothetical protein [unclassified Arthrobacter]MDQ0821342.1 hypothetical protein [Arthrobacter sp. V1I7]MDQ0855606.1 hypothetical protein [Arthrobacter sp. V4I6]